jgi:DNA-3-methyladenine glycosylase
LGMRCTVHILACVGFKHLIGITGEDYGRDLCGERLFLEELPRGTAAVGKIGRSARINVDYAGAWAAKPWRFYERGNRYVSVRPRD